VRAHGAFPVEHRPHAAGFIASAVGALALRRRRRERRTGRILGAQRLQRRALDSQQLLDRALGLLVSALAEVVVEQPRAAVEQVPRRPALVLVLAPKLEL
jgi:hypothetical protein